MREVLIVAACMLLHGPSGSLFAQQPAEPSPKHSPARRASPDMGSIVNGRYQNVGFRFSYRLPFGWVDRTSDIREDTEKSKVLLAIFERPPAASGDTVNSAVIIAAESVDAYPGLKNAAQYFGSLTELAESKGFKAVNEPYEFPVDGRAVVRGDFTKERGSVTMHQSSLVIMARGYLVSFTFLAGSDNDVAESIEKLSFEKKAP